MPTMRVASYRNPLDVLWRGVPMPFKAGVRVAQLCVSVESNDSELLAVISRPAASPLGSRQSNFLWRIVRDEETPGTLEPAVTLKRDELAFATMGAAVIVAVDNEKKELLAFVGCCVDEATFRGTVFPRFERMTLDAFEPRSSFESAPTELAIAKGREDE